MHLLKVLENLAAIQITLGMATPYRRFLLFRVYTKPDGSPAKSGESTEGNNFNETKMVLARFAKAFEKRRFLNDMGLLGENAPTVMKVLTAFNWQPISIILLWLNYVMQD